ncbi:hypothetical protein PIB30_097380 [Stylosanthes scabra]|uniref:Uncharacterized protein n=1 Tax=Stylosanthes scabra TaxID=79078 RepID=A0ABU6UX21_9FABA|nr:hypothetical protein [Stylosanthes scabra]
MESGELMLRIHDECLILNIYKSMHSSSGAKTCMKINSVDPASTKPPERSEKTIGNNSQDKESAKDFQKDGTKDFVKFQQIQTVPMMPYLPTTMGSNNKTYMITEGVCNKFFEPP